MHVNPSVSVPSSLGSASLACDCGCLMDLSFLFIYFGAFCTPFVFTMHWWSNRSPCQVHRAFDMRNPHWGDCAIVLSGRMCFCLHPCSFLSQLTATQRINHTVDQPALVGKSKGYFEVESPPSNSGARKNFSISIFFDLLIECIKNMKYVQFLDVAALHCNLEAPSMQPLPYERTIINYQNSCTQVSVISQAFLHTKIFIVSSHQWKAPAVWKTANRLQISLCEEVPNHGYGLWLTNQHRKWRFIIMPTTTSEARCCCDLVMPNCCTVETTAAKKLWLIFFLSK